MSEEKKDEILEQEKELNMDELDAVAGGDTCGCIGAGSGKAGEGQNACACVAGGYGEYDEAHKYYPRCGCFLGGGGVDG